MDLPADPLADDPLFETELYVHLLHCADFLRRHFAAGASEPRLAGADFRALRELALHPSPMAPSALASLLRCSRGQVTRISRRLCAAGYITEQRVPWAAHAKTLEMTPAGRDVLARLLARVEHADRFAALTKRQRWQLFQLLCRLGRSFEPAAFEATSASESSCDGNHFRRRK